ncbi:MAG TPA: hypothetical protein DGZ24_06905 [Rhodospirillaceae bacterium]|nr:hypothetical protein [Candidatus Neomarinimicrobiota bacterium]HCX15029.1 hypothetical protein [Rhodospirillaceae bacterium]
MNLKQKFFFLIAVIGGLASPTTISYTAENSSQNSPTLSSVELESLRRIYPPGYSDSAIRTIENGQVPDDMTVPEYSRLHCGEIGIMVFNPCLVSYLGEYGSEYVVIAQGGNKRVGSIDEATSFFRAQLRSKIPAFESEISAINAFVDTLCDHMAEGGDIREALPPRNEWPRIDHPIAPPNSAAKHQFSDLFTWDKCKNCVGIVAVNMANDLPPTCANLSKEPVPRITYFVVDRQTSRGHRTLDSGLEVWKLRVSNK